jgi:hypothetical protein
MKAETLRELAGYIENNQLETAAVYLSGQKKVTADFIVYKGDDPVLVRRAKRLGRVKVVKNDYGARLVGEPIPVSPNLEVRFEIAGVFACEKVGEQEVAIPEEQAAAEAVYLTNRIAEISERLRDAKRGVVRKPITHCKRI